MMKMSQIPSPFADIWLFYRSEDDPGMWVGHSLFTDQVAVGKCVLEAYTVLRRVIRALLEEAKADPAVRVFQPAPKEVMQRLQKSRPLSREITARADELLARRRRPRDPRRGNLRAVVEMAEG